MPSCERRGLGVITVAISVSFGSCVWLGDLYRRANRYAEASAAYERALVLAQQEPERRFLRKRLKQLDDVRES